MNVINLRWMIIHLMMYDTSYEIYGNMVET